MAMSEAEILFKEEEMEKKKIGRNIFNKKGYRTRGIQLGNSYFFMSNKEKAQLNGEVKSYDLKKILPYAEYSKLTDDIKKLFLQFWTTHYSKEEILNQFGSEQILKFECKRLGVSLDMNQAQLMKTKQERSPKESNQDVYLKGIISFEAFKKLSIEEKVRYLKKASKKYSLVSISKFWGKSPSYASTILYYVKRSERQKQKKLLMQMQTALQEKANKETETKKDWIVETKKEGSVVMQELVQEEAKKEVSTNMLRFELNQEMTVEELQSILNGFATFLGNQKVKIKLAIEA